MPQKKNSKKLTDKSITQFLINYRSSRPGVFLGKGVLKICSKFTREHPCRSVISIKLLWNFIEIALRHGRSPVNFLYIFSTRFPKNTSRRLLLRSAVTGSIFNNAADFETAIFQNVTPLQLFLKILSTAAYTTTCTWSKCYVFFSLKLLNWADECT